MVTTFSMHLLVQIGALGMREGGDRPTAKRMSCLLKGCQFLMAATLLKKESVSDSEVTATPQNQKTSTFPPLTRRKEPNHSGKKDEIYECLELKTDPHFEGLCYARDGRRV